MPSMHIDIEAQIEHISPNTATLEEPIYDTVQIPDGAVLRKPDCVP
jgi:hypothetical protein